MNFKGKIAKPPQILEVSELTREDIAKLRNPRDNSAYTRIGKIRDSHHMVARLLAMGLSDREIAAATGYSVTRIGTLKVAPAIQDLKAGYAREITERTFEMFDPYLELVALNRNRAERMIADRLEDIEEEGGKISLRDLMAISRDAADRTGLGKHTSSTNVNVEFGTSLERAIAESTKVIEGSGLPPLPPPGIKRRI